MFDQVDFGVYKDFKWEEKDLIKPPKSFLDIKFSSTVSEWCDSLQNHGQAECILPFGKSKLFSVPVKESTILVDSREQDDKRVVELTLDIKDILFDFLPGDTIGIIPKNTAEDVNWIIKILDLENVADKICNISINPEISSKHAKIPLHIPQNCTIRKILKECVALTFLPKKQFFRILFDYTNNEQEKNILGALCAKNSTCFNDALKFRFNLLNALRYLTSCRPAIAVLLENLPRLLPRPYSIANSPLIQRDEIKIVFSILNSNPGLTTDLLNKLSSKLIENSRQSETIDLYLRERNSFKYSEEEFTKNLIMISVGCAIAPFIGFMQHKLEIYEQNSNEIPGKAWLFTGFRYKHSSLYKHKINRFINKKILDKHFESLSRDSFCKNRYVQDCIMENAEEFVNMLLDDNTIIYLCADGADISKSIEQVIQTCISNVTNCNVNEAKQLLLCFKKNGKYREDIWV